MSRSIVSRIGGRHAGGGLRQGRLPPESHYGAVQAIGNDRDDDTYQDVAVLEEEPDSDIDDFEPGSDDDDPIRVPGTNKRKANSTKNPGPSQKKKKK